MTRKAKTVAELNDDLDSARARFVNSRLIGERSEVHKDIKRIEAAIIRAERREQRDGELS